jgi:hypothetical protein
VYDNQHGACACGDVIGAAAGGEKECHEIGGYPHFMLKEIHEQPQTILDTMRGRYSYETGEADLRQAFEAFGQVTKATVITDKFTGRSKGFGFVEMPCTFLSVG